MRLIHGMRGWFVVGLFCLCVLFYYGINNHGVKTKHQSALNEGADAALLARPLSEGKMASEVVLPVKEDASFPDHDDIDLIAASRVIDQAPVSVGKHLDPEADPGVFDTTRSSHQKNVGMFLDVDGEPGDQVSSGPLPQRNVGTFIDVDGNNVNSCFFLSNGSKEVNIGNIYRSVWFGVTWQLPFFIVFSQAKHIRKLLCYCYQSNPGISQSVTATSSPLPSSWIMAI